MKHQGSVYIISLKFAPGLKKEFMVLGENIRRKKDFPVSYIISEKYASMGGDCNCIEYIQTGDGIRRIITDTLRLGSGERFQEIFFSNTPVFACFYNPHPLNPFIARLIKKKFSCAKTALFLHDPYKPDKKPYGFKKAAYIKLVEFVQKLTVKYMDYVISPSEYSSCLFRKYYPDFKGENYTAPLLIPDAKTHENSVRRFFSIIGSAHPATGHETFVELINYVAEKKLDYNFALISSSNISRYLVKLSDGARKILKVVNKKIVTDSEINEIIKQSYVVFRLDREVTQSGVIPVAYMNATPVIVRDIQGLRQHVKDRETGYIVPLNCNPENLVSAMNFVKQNFFDLSKNARRYYEIIWDEKNWDNYYKWLDILYSDIRR